MKDTFDSPPSHDLGIGERGECIILSRTKQRGEFVNEGRVWCAFLTSRVEVSSILKKIIKECYLFNLTLKLSTFVNTLSFFNYFNSEPEHFILLILF